MHWKLHRGLKCSSVGEEVTSFDFPYILNCLGMVSLRRFPRFSMLRMRNSNKETRLGGVEQTPINSCAWGETEVPGEINSYDRGEQYNSEDCAPRFVEYEGICPRGSLERFVKSRRNCPRLVEPKRDSST